MPVASMIPIVAGHFGFPFGTKTVIIPVGSAPIRRSGASQLVDPEVVDRRRKKSRRL
jgi:hypothetical protein